MRWLIVNILTQLDNNDVWEVSRFVKDCNDSFRKGESNCECTDRISVCGWDIDYRCYQQCDLG